MWKAVQWCLWIVGILGIGYWAQLSVKARVSQVRGAWELERPT